LLLAKIITTITLSADKIQRPLNQPFIAPNSHENPAWHREQGVSGPWPWEKKPPWLFLFSSFPN
jgi:hypothetical protein